MTLVVKFKDNSLYCLDCGKRVMNTANAEMRDYGTYSYSHSCKKNKEVRDRLKKELGW